MGKFKLCFIFDENGDYKPVPYSKLMNGKERRPEYADRYCIPLNGYLLEVTHEDYLDHYKAVNRQQYIRKEEKRVTVLSLQAMYEPNDDSVLELCEDITEHVHSEMMIASLHAAITLLKEDERRLIQMLYFDRQTERQCAEVFGVYRNAIHVRKKRILERLRMILSD